MAVQIKMISSQGAIVHAQGQTQSKTMAPERVQESTEPGPLCITDLFQNKSVAYFFKFSPLFMGKENIFYKRPFM